MNSVNAVRYSFTRWTCTIYSLPVSRRTPVYPDQRTSSDRPGMSVGARNGPTATVEFGASDVIVDPNPTFGAHKSSVILIYAASITASISTVILKGNEAIPTAQRACRPRSPNTWTKRSEQPLMTFG